MIDWPPIRRRARTGKSDICVMASPAYLVRYDAARRRLWVLGQRCHHGATGALLTGVAAGLLAARVHVRGLVTVAAAGSLMMVHDWQDRGLWFERGVGTQP
jgi:hypothetical protein